MAETFRNRIDALTGFAVINSTDSDDAISDWLTDGAKELLTILPPNKLEECVATSTVTSSSGFSLDTATTGSVLGVSRKNAIGIKQTCRKTSSLFDSRIEDEDDLMFASTTDPVYYISGSTVKIFPTPTSAQSAEVIYVPLPSIAHGDTSIGTDYSSVSGVTATAADPTVFTKASHGFVDGDIVRLSNFTEMTEINGMVGTVNQLNSSTFEVNGVAADPAETTGGIVEKVVGGFPDEYEYAVILYASIKAAQSLLASEEDDDLYVPMINTLKQDYIQVLTLIGAKLPTQKKPEAGNKDMQKMLNQMLEYGK